MVRIEVDWAPPKIGGSGGASSRNPPPEQRSLFANTGPALPESITPQTANGVPGEVDAGKAYWRQVIDAIRETFGGRKPVPPTYESTMMGHDGTSGFGGQVGSGNPPEE